MIVVKNKLSPDGFAKVILVVAVLVCFGISSIGVLIYQYGNPHYLSKATSYNYSPLGSQVAFTASNEGINGSPVGLYACKVLDNPGTYTIYSKAIITSPDSNRYLFILNDRSIQDGSILHTANTDTWIGNNTATLSYPIASSHANSIQALVDILGNSGWVAPKTLPTYISLNKLASC